MSRTNNRTSVALDQKGKRFRWYSPDGIRKSKPIPNYHSLDPDQIENLRSSLELTLNSGSIDPFNGMVVTSTMTMAQLWAHYKENEMSNLRGHTAQCYQTIWRGYISPRWDRTLVAEIKTVAVEQWLRELTLQNGQPASKEYKVKIRNIMSAMFSHAIRYDLANRNPISCGGSDIGKGGKRGAGAGVRILGEFADKRETVYFTPDQVLTILGELDNRDRALVLLDGVLGLRRGELGGLHWEDCQFDKNLFVIRHSFDWKAGKENPPKTYASAAKLPMHAVLQDALVEWRSQTPYLSPHDYVFPSQRLRGSKPIDLKEVFVKNIKPAIEGLGYARRGQHYGWHSFRHGVGTALWDLTRDKLTVRDLLRHGRTDICDRYIHGIDSRLIEAQNKLVIAIGLKSSPARRVRMSHHRR
jgi:integrase